MEKSEVIEPI